MADDSSSLSTDKPVVESSSASSRSSSGGRGGGQSGFGNRQVQRKQESKDSTETSVSLTTSSPAKSTKVGSNNNRERKPSYSRDSREGRQRRGGGVGREKEHGQRNKATPSAGVELPSGESTSTLSVGGQNQESSGSITNKKDNNKKKYAVKKRAPPKEDIEIKPNDVFVNEKSHFVAQLSKCKKLFEKGHREVFLHGLGKAIPRAINIAFELKKFYHNTVDYTVNTSTVQLFDDVVDLEDLDQLPSVRTRNVSSVDIKVYRSLNIP